MKNGRARVSPPIFVSQSLAGARLLGRDGVQSFCFRFEAVDTTSARIAALQIHVRLGSLGPVASAVLQLSLDGFLARWSNAAAYDWPADLSDAEILTRLPALNAARAAEDAAGTIRWLRPEYQNRTGPTTQSGLETTTKGAKDAKTNSKTSKAKIAWPKSLAKRFARAKPEDLAKFLATLGRANRDGERFSA